MLLSTHRSGIEPDNLYASSAPYTLKVLTIVAVILLPIVIAYQAWTYWVFRKRIEAKPETLTY
jgi:cytochrome bd-type quinol oxidase subunit 2